MAPEGWRAAGTVERHSGRRSWGLRLLRGDTLDAVSRDSQIPAHELEAWKRAFLEQARASHEAGEHRDAALELKLYAGLATSR